jgi:uncharacterized surface anchored protein
VRIRAGEVKEITVTNEAEPDETPKPEEKPGRLVLLKKADGTGEKLSGAVFGVYRSADDTKITELTTDRYGEAATSLPAGNYYLRELTAPAGFILNTDRISVTVKAGEVKEITVTNKPQAVTTPTPIPNPPATPTPPPTTDKPVPPASATPTPTNPNLHIIKQAAQTGKYLSGAVFGVYRVSDNGKITELTTDADGEASYTLENGDYYLRELKAPYGYIAEAVRIYFTVSDGAAVKVEVTNQRDPNITDAEIPGGEITIPKTGEDFPALNYVFGISLLLAAALCGVCLMRKKHTITKGGLI